MIDLTGKVAIVTGAAMGMGEATARVFAAAGARVLVSDINPELGEATAERIRADGGDASFCRTDVSSAADAAAMVSSFYLNSTWKPYPYAQWQRPLTDQQRSYSLFDLK